MDGSSNLCHNVTVNNALFPSEHDGSLDYDLLGQLGLTKMRKCDALFFFQLLLPIIKALAGAGEESSDIALPSLHL